MPNIFSILLMLGILSSLIIVHEFGHFAVARFFGFQTPVFGFGLPFGPSITLGQRWETQFKIHPACLLGGYVAIPELGDESSLAHEAYGVPLKPFKKFPIWQRALVAFAGVAMNMIFAYVVMIVMVVTVGLPIEKVYVENLAENIPIAKAAGVQSGDRIAAIDNLKIRTSEQVIDYLSKHKAAEVTMHIVREPEAVRGTLQGEKDGTPVDIKVTTNADGKVGMMLVRPTEKIQGNPIEICSKAFSELWDLTSQMLSTLGRMGHNIFFGWAEPHPKGAPAQAGIGDLHGVLVVIKWGADLADTDWTKLFTFTALISMDLAIVNLLPIPALDGGHLFFQLLEAIRGKPMEEKIHSELVKWGFIGLLTLMAVIMVNDIRALFTGELDFKGKKKPGQTQPKKDDSKNGAQDPAKDPSTDPSKSQSQTTDPTKDPATGPTKDQATDPTKNPVTDPIKDPAADSKNQSPSSTETAPAPDAPKTDEPIKGANPDPASTTAPTIENAAKTNTPVPAAR